VGEESGAVAAQVRLDPGGLTVGEQFGRAGEDERADGGEGGNDLRILVGGVIGQEQALVREAGREGGGEAEVRQADHRGEHARPGRGGGGELDEQRRVGDVDGRAAGQAAVGQQRRQEGVDGQGALGVFAGAGLG
jgi:hypothetical protein